MNDLLSSNAQVFFQVVNDGDSEAATLTSEAWARRFLDEYHLQDDPFIGRDTYLTKSTTPADP